MPGVQMFKDGHGAWSKLFAQLLSTMLSEDHLTVFVHDTQIQYINQLDNIMMNGIHPTDDWLQRLESIQPFKESLLVDTNLPTVLNRLITQFMDQTIVCLQLEVNQDEFVQIVDLCSKHNILLYAVVDWYTNIYHFKPTTIII